MNRILFVYERKMATINILMDIFENIFIDTNIEYEFKKNVQVSKSDVEITDVFFFIRANNYLSQKIAEKARKSGCYVIFYMDDDLFNLPKSMPSIPWRKKALLKVLHLSDIIVSSSPLIVDKYYQETIEKRGVQMNTPVSTEEFLPSPQNSVKQDRRIKLVYAASRNHEDLFNRLVLPVLPKLDIEFGDKISLTFVGVHPEFELQKYRMPIYFQSSMSFVKYRDYMKKSKFDIGLAPLFDDPFSHCKYFNKFIEYTMVGIVGIYSDCRPYTFVINNGENGMLAQNSPESWFTCICELLDDKVRGKCLNGAMAKIKQEFTIDKIKESLFKQIPEIFEKRDKKKCSSFIIIKLIYKFARVADTIYLIMFYLRNKNIVGLLKRIKMHFKEKRAING